MSMYKLSIEYPVLESFHVDKTITYQVFCFLIPFQDTLLMRELNILINNITPG